MLVFIPSPSPPDHARALRGVLARSAPASLLDAFAATDVLPPASAPCERFSLLCDTLASLVDAHEARGTRRHVVALDPQDAPLVPTLAFWLRRRHGQAAFMAPPSTGPASKWAQAAAESISLGDPRLRVAIWEPDPPIIRTPRLTLTFPTAEQVLPYHDRIVGTSIFETLMWDGPASPQELLDRNVDFRRLAAKGPRSPLVLGMIENATGNQIGGLGCRPHDRDPARMELGYSIQAQSHGKGYGTEAIGAFVGFLFECRGAERIEAEVFVGNWPSRRVLEKNGFVCEVERSPHRCPKRGERRDEWAFAITRPMWERGNPPR